MIAKRCLEVCFVIVLVLVCLVFHSSFILSLLGAKNLLHTCQLQLFCIPDGTVALQSQILTTVLKLPTHELGVDVVIIEIKFKVPISFGLQMSEKISNGT